MNQPERTPIWQPGQPKLLDREYIPDTLTLGIPHFSDEPPPGATGGHTVLVDAYNPARSSSANGFPKQ